MYVHLWIKFVNIAIEPIDSICSKIALIVFFFNFIFFWMGGCLFMKIVQMSYDASLPTR